MRGGEIVKSFAISVIGFLAPVTVWAAESEMMQESGVVGQLKELLPFVHLQEGHWLAMIVSAILWASLVYTVYAIIQKVQKK